jgi:chemotaxis family two-component system response regulator Rcp1
MPRSYDRTEASAPSWMNVETVVASRFGVTTSPPKGSSQWRIMESELRRTTRRISLKSLNVYTRVTPIQGQGLGWPFVSASLSGPDGEAVLNPRAGEDPSSASPSGAGPAARRHKILVIEDNRADIFLIREALREAQLEVDLDIVNDGEAASRLIDAADRDRNIAVPDLILLDLNLPLKSGPELLQLIRLSHRHSRVRVIVVTSSDSERDRQVVSRLGANVFFRKPSSYEAFLKLGEVVGTVLESSTGSHPQ